MDSGGGVRNWEVITIGICLWWARLCLSYYLGDWAAYVTGLGDGVRRRI